MEFKRDITSTAEEIQDAMNSLYDCLSSNMTEHDGGWRGTVGGYLDGSCNTKIQRASKKIEPGRNISSRAQMMDMGNL